MTPDYCPACCWVLLPASVLSAVSSFALSLNLELGGSVSITVFRILGSFEVENTI